MTIINVVARLVVREPGDPKPAFVRRVFDLPITPFVGLQLTDLSPRDKRKTGGLKVVYDVVEIRAHIQLGAVELFVQRHGDAHPLQPSLTLADALDLGWERDGE